MPSPVDRRTDRIKAAIAGELEQRRPQLDRRAGLRQVSVLVRLDKQGEPVSTLYREESESAVTRPHRDVEA